MVPEARRKVAANYAEERYTSKSNPVKARIQSGASLYLRLKAGAHPGSDGEITMWNETMQQLFGDLTLLVSLSVSFRKDS